MISRIHNDRNGKVHAIGIYQANSDHGYKRHPGGNVNVIVTPKAHPVVLVLCSYEPVTWNVQIEPGASVSQIVVGGYHRQKVTGAGTTVPTTVQTYETSAAWGPNVQVGDSYFYAYKRPDAPQESTHFPLDVQGQAFFREHQEYERQQDLDEWRKLFYSLESATGEKDVSTFQGTYHGRQFYI